MATVATRTKNNNILSNLGFLSKGKQKGYIFIIGGIAAFVFFCLLSVWPHQKKILLLKQTKVKQKLLLESQQINTELKVQLEHLLSYRKVEKYAEEKLQMRFPRRGEVVYVRKAGSARE